MEQFIRDNMSAPPRFDIASEEPGKVYINMTGKRLNLRQHN